MKINEIEQLVGITKKNIRFYEEQGLIVPGRGANGYREYTDQDVELLLKIKLLRRLSIPIEEIRKLLEGKLSLKDCLERHQIYLNHEKTNLELTYEVCQELGKEGFHLTDLPAKLYLEKLQEMEKGGMRFMDVSKVDVGKKKRGAQIAAVVIIACMLAWDAIMFIGNSIDPMPKSILALMTVPTLFVIGGVVLALRERMKEIEGGEADEATNY